MDKKDLAKYIDHTNVRPYASEKDILKLCDEAIKYGFASACVASCWVPLAREKLSGSGVRVCSVVGFPFGAEIYHTKAFEAKTAVASGADEIDAVINIGYLKSGRLDYMASELSGIVEASGNATVKIIIETCYLTPDEIIQASKLVRNSGAAFVKTSTGYGPSGARLEDVELIKTEVPGIRIKASGGIRTLEDANKFINAGASRIGTSAGPTIVEDL
ncbi:deoxyribose-phosphate aldolase [Methanocella sp. CWC-04]|uniref:Deoxyribose-phosphate aldolase n=1 Tax=Methanooceanicella nereidis TaxID=2052831 RepID=A0AAP2RBL0_9EURY|nr:deoxyribose-phosphate aldolase [Methanocella sp. CWC-04]MCD1294468.1 deoxyribose-phosphate aldolase [Methanocella sp. CWC-04]